MDSKSMGGLFWHQYYMSQFFSGGGGGRVSIFFNRVLHNLGALFWLDIIVKLPGCQLQVEIAYLPYWEREPVPTPPNDSFGSPSFWMIKL